MGGASRTSDCGMSETGGRQDGRTWQTETTKKMCEINLEDLEKAKNLFQYYRYKYEEIAIAFSKLNYTDTKYSNIYMDFFPYQSERIGNKPGKFYKRTPKNISNTITNMFIDDKIYYCYVTKGKEAGERFYIYEEEQTLYLCYTINHKTNKMELSMIYILESQKGEEQKGYFFMEDTAFGYRSMTFLYKYNNERISNLYSYLFDFVSNIWILTQELRFEYIENDYIIYSKRKDDNESCFERQIYASKSR